MSKQDLDGNVAEGPKEVVEYYIKVRTKKNLRGPAPLFKDRAIRSNWGLPLPGEAGPRSLELTEYASLACDFLEYLVPETVIHRLAASAQEPCLVAPTETKLLGRDSYQRIRIGSS